MQLNTRANAGCYTHREEVVKKGQKPPCDIHGDYQREENCTAIAKCLVSKLVEGAGVKAGDGCRASHQPLRNRLETQLDVTADATWISNM